MTEAASQETKSVIVERDFAAPPEKLWRALTQPQLIAEWLMQNDFQPAIGHRFKLTGEWGGVLDCEVLAIDEGRTLSYTWDFTHDDPAYNLKSVVTFILTPIGGGTNLRVEQAGFHPGQTQAYGGAKAGWQKFLRKLDDLLTRLV